MPQTSKVKDNPNNPYFQINFQSKKTGISGKKISRLCRKPNEGKK